MSKILNNKAVKKIFLANEMKYQVIGSKLPFIRSVLSEINLFFNASVTLVIRESMVC